MKRSSVNIIEEQPDSRDKVFRRLRGAVGLLLLLGLTWLFAIFTVGEANIVFEYIFCMLNTLQGFFIFLVYCVANKDVRTALKASCCKKYSKEFSSNSKDG